MTAAGAPAQSGSADLLDRWPARIAVVGIALLALAVLFLLARRLAGGLSAALSTSALLATVAIAAGFALGLHALAFQFAPTYDSRRSRAFVQWGPAAALLGLAAALSIPGIDWGGALGLWGIAAAGALVMGRENVRSSRRAAVVEEAEASPPAESCAAPSTIDDADGSVVLQEFARLRDAEGRESVRGTIRAEFAEGDRTAILHVAFCPPFGCTPEFDCELTAGPEAQIRPGPVQPYGVRLEVRLAEAPATATEVVVEFAAYEPE